MAKLLEAMAGHLLVCLPVLKLYWSKSSSSQIVNLAASLFLFALALPVAYLLLFRTDRPPRTRHPTIRSKSTTRSYQDTNSAASLLARVTELRGQTATWPRMLQSLNPDDNPQVRTVLLELRHLHVARPVLVLDAIEAACLASHRESHALSLVDLLDRAKHRLT